MSSIDEEASVAYGMETFNWRGDNVRGAEVEVKGGADAITFSSSQEANIEEVLGNSNCIVKTTHFVVEEQDAVSISEEKKWSNV